MTEGLWTSSFNRLGRPQMMRTKLSSGGRMSCDSCGKTAKENEWMLVFTYGNRLENLYELTICDVCEGWQLRSHLHSYLALKGSKEVKEMGYSEGLVIPTEGT